MTILQDILAAVGWQTRVNENFQCVSPAALFSRDPATSTGLTLGYLGGVLDGVSYSNGTHLLTASTTRYVVVKRSDGVVSSSTGTTNWNNGTDYMRMGVAVVGASTVTSWTDWREAYATVTGGGGAVDRSTVTALSIASGVVDIDCGLGDYFTLALTANVTSITFSNLPGSGKGASLMIRITQDSTPRTVAWPASFRWEGAAPSVSTGSGDVDLLAISTLDNGTKWDGTLSKARA